MTHRLVEHTADIAIEAEGNDEGEALAEAAIALAEVITGEADIHALQGARTQFNLRVEAPDHCALAVAFLAELVWHLESVGLLWVGGGIVVAPTSDGLAAIASGNALRYDPVQHGHGVEVKAITYHEIQSKRQNGGWFLRVILDL